MENILKEIGNMIKVQELHFSIFEFEVTENFILERKFIVNENSY